jgi:hypothetical protein
MYTHTHMPDIPAKTQQDLNVSRHTCTHTHSHTFTHTHTHMHTHTCAHTHTCTHTHAHTHTHMHTHTHTLMPDIPAKTPQDSNASRNSLLMDITFIQRHAT